MPNRDYGDVLGGAILIAVGGFVVYYTGTTYAVGGLRQIGPGFFPVTLGVMLGFLGAIVFVGGMLHRGMLPTFKLRPFVTIVLGVLAFAAAIRPLGIVPAVTAVTVAAVLAENRVGPIGTVVLAIGMSAVSVLIFRFALNVYIPIARWPF